MDQDVIDDTVAQFAAAGLSSNGTGWKDKGFNIGFNHNIPKAKVDLYAGMSFNELDVPTGVSSVDDIITVTVGTKLKFD